MTTAHQLPQPMDESFFHPEIFVVTESKEQFQSYIQTITEAGYRVQLAASYDDFVEIASEAEGAIVFLSWELPECTAQELSLEISQALNCTCIVFAESDSIQTRAEMASAKLERSIQPPYSPKNFVMAIQKIITERQDENDQRIRKINHYQRLQLVPESSSQPMVNSEDLIEESPEAVKQELNHFSGEVPDWGHTQFEGDSSTPTTELFEGQREERTFEHSSGDPMDGGHQHFSGARENDADDDISQFMHKLESASSANESLANKSLWSTTDPMEGETLDYSSFNESTTASNVGQGPLAWQDVELPALPDQRSNLFAALLEQKMADNSGEQFSDRDWALIVLGCLVGLGICCFLLAQVFLSSYLQ